MPKKQQAIKFDTLNKSSVKGKVGHTRTGACTSSGRCYHGWNTKHNKKAK